jgi:NAD(P)-dependent dehydrogenase (short-subunit alcohol dehydrogenase family)
LGWLTPEELAEIWTVNAGAPVALTTALLPYFREGALLVSISSDAAVEHYDNWGGYGAAKAALDHFTLTLGVESGLRAYAVDPGDMRTAMHQAAFPGEDISDRPLPASVVPRLLDLIANPPAPGRYRLSEFADEASRAI